MGKNDPKKEPILSPFMKGIPPSDVQFNVEAVREAGVVLIKAAHQMKAPMVRVQIGGFITFDIEGEWEVIARRIK